MAHQCPTCGKNLTEQKELSPSKNPSYPFCCERCKLIDLGGWFDVRYKITTDIRQIGDDELQI